MVRSTHHPRLAGALTALAIMLAWSLPLAAGAAGTILEGTIFNADGDPVPECRVVARTVSGTEVYISQPSDRHGHYELAVPLGEQYLIVALVAPTGGRVALPDPETLAPIEGGLVRDIRIPLPVAPTPRRGLKGVAGVDRFFLSFVEDPALVERHYVELQIARVADAKLPDAWEGRLIAAFRPPRLRRVEIGLRGGYASIRAGAGTESGARDLDVWGKLHLFRSKGSLWDVVVGGLVTLPTGDENIGLGADSTQSKVFVAVSRALSSVLLMAHAGARSTEHGAIDGSSVDGRISESAGIGVFFPVSPRSSVVFEFGYDGERFDTTESDSRVLLGWNRRVGRRGTLRMALAGGLEDESADTEFLLGFATAF